MQIHHKIDQNDIFVISTKQKFMFSSTTPEKIKNSPHNTSPTKYHWSFTKAPRFQPINSYCKSFSYDKKSTLSRRNTSIGYGNRSSVFDGRKETIAPGRYHTIAGFDNKKLKRGYSFGYGRQDLSFGDYHKLQERTPSPFAYESGMRKSKAYSIRSKKSYPKNYFIYSEKEQKAKRREPGPGRYETIDPLGSNFHSSKHINRKRVSLIGIERFLPQKVTPGPTDYQIFNIKQYGKYFLSTMQTCPLRSFPHEKRSIKWAKNKEYPGPGTYQMPSDFGHYNSNVRPRTAR